MPSSARSSASELELLRADLILGDCRLQRICLTAPLERRFDELEPDHRDFFERLQRRFFDLRIAMLTGTQGAAFRLAYDRGAVPDHLTASDGLRRAALILPVLDDRLSRHASGWAL